MNKQYTLIEEVQLDALNGVGKLYKHNKSGAQVVVILNDDNNKTFSVSFKTPPKDNTGLPHILEHSVLCGSRKFPIKDPFVELAKGSLNTFLNAMTFSDKTMYPIASCNDKDFENLMDVYMDAVFYPNIHKEAKIFKQEGWHYSLENVEDDLKYTGVVYNEMKGAYSSSERLLMRNIELALFPDNEYGLESGGYPDNITELTYEDFAAFHKEYYHPANSYIYLYGDIDEDQKLQWIDENYLSNFEEIEVDSSIKKQEAFGKMIDVHEYYPISSEESSEKKTFIAASYVVSEAGDQFAHIGNEILEYVLFEAPGAPIKKGLLESGICEDVFSILDNDVMQPAISIVAKGCNPEDKDRFVKIVNDEVNRIVENGIDKEKVTAALNRFEFRAREADFGRYPKGIMYAITSLESWLHDKSPFIYFDYDKIYDFLRKGIETGYFDQLMRDYFVDSQHGAVIVLEPDNQISSKREEEIRLELEKYKASLSEDQLKALVEETKALEAYQNEKETPEGLNSVPLLSLEDIGKEITHLPYTVENLGEAKLVKHVTFTNNIVYSKLAFDLSGIPEALVPYVGLLKNVLGKVNTDQYDYSKLSDMINLHTGGLAFSAAVYGVNEDPNAFKPYFEITGKCFDDKIEKLFELVEEILLNTDFADEGRLKEIMGENKSRVATRLTNNGHVTALTRSESYYSKSSYYSELISGISYYDFIDDLYKNFDDRKGEVIEKLKSLMTIIFRSENLVVSLTVDEDKCDTVSKEIEKLAGNLYKEEVSTSKVDIEVSQKNEGFKTSAKIQFVGKSGNYIEEGYKYTGSLKVLKTILSLDYLWTNIRVKGGAYGAMLRIKRSGALSFVSYRDPNLENTLKVYDGVSEYIASYDADDREMLKYIIGTVSELDQPLTKSMENERVLAYYITEITKDMLQKERDEVLSTNVGDIQALSSLVKDALKQNNICVVGNEGMIEKSKGVFKEVKNLLN